MSSPVFIKSKANWIEVDGAFGKFQAPGSPSEVTYILTHASLGTGGTGNTTLTKYLVPMRELPGSDKLKFDELLQRDLDDNRVASEIIPYLLDHSAASRFFPPVLAVVVPVDGTTMLSTYPELSYNTEDIYEYDENGRKQLKYTKEICSYGNVLQTVRYKSTTGEYSLNGSFLFNPDKAKIVILDGQHRAMAILAIRRAKTGEWGENGNEYSHFYVDVSGQLRDQDILNKLEKIELPICLAFMPEVRKGGKAEAVDLVPTFRKLFIDVNKEARKPSRSRELLLDDSNLASVFCRSLLSLAREKNEREGTYKYNIDIDSFEYDSPRQSPKPIKETTICTIEMLFEAIRTLLFSDDKFYKRLDSKPASGGRFSYNVSRFLKEFNASSEITSELISEWGYVDLENELDPEYIQIKCHSTFRDLFIRSWGNQILKFLSTLHPYAAHIQAVTSLKNEHALDTGPGRLAWKALFDGQGIYWTLQEYFDSRVKKERDLGHDLPPTAVGNAYKMITTKWIPIEFIPSRAQFYFGPTRDGKIDDDKVNIANRSYKIYRTMAFQIGFMMAFAHLKAKLNIQDFLEFDNATTKWIDALNYAFKFNNKSNKGLKSLSMFDKEGQGLLARHFGRLQKNDWVWFRYFALEMLNAVSDKCEVPGKEIVCSSALELRKQYIGKLSASIKERDRREGVKSTDDKIRKRAIEAWGGALRHSLDIDKAKFEGWASANIEIHSEITEEAPDTDSDNGDDMASEL